LLKTKRHCGKVWLLFGHFFWNICKEIIHPKNPLKRNYAKRYRTHIV
jgi:hypothetical protein